jgi:putative phosphoribosyl transferase
LPPSADRRESEVAVAVDGGPTLPGTLTVPAGARAIVLFAHGSGSGRSSPRNRQVAAALHGAAIATLLFDLLTEPEAADRGNVFAVDLLAGRLLAAARWARAREELRALPLGFFGASTGAAAALIAAAELRDGVGAVVSRGGRPDLAGRRLGDVAAPTLLIVGGRDEVVLGLNRDARRQLTGAPSELEIVAGATHLFEERGALEQVAALATDWFARRLAPG